MPDVPTDLEQFKAVLQTLLRESYLSSEDQAAIVAEFPLIGFASKLMNSKQLLESFFNEGKPELAIQTIITEYGVPYEIYSEFYLHSSEEIDITTLE
jgi:hypothetical protein